MFDFRRKHCQLAMVILLLLPSTTLGQEPAGDRLKDLAPPDIAVGGVLGGYDTDLNNLPILDTIRTEFNAVTVKAFMPFGPWTNPFDPIDTSGLTRNVDWAYNNGKRIHGHVLVYPTENTRLRWFQDLPNEEVAPLLSRYVQTMAGSTVGRIWVWDVVNEVIGDNGDVMDENGLRMGLGTVENFTPYKEYYSMGPDYIRLAFEWAKAADPFALLIINEYSAEALGDKSDRLFNLCVRLKAQGVPIDGVGFQNHWLNTNYEPDYPSIRANFQRFADAGFKIFITECDVAAKVTSDPQGDPPSSIELERQRRIYRNLMQIVLDQPACKSFLMWDFTDESSWLQNTNFTLTLADRREGFSDTVIPPGNSMFATPFNGGDGFSPITAKPAYYGLQEALVNHQGSVYRFTSGWDHPNSYLARSGGFDTNGNFGPSRFPYVERLDDFSAGWSSLKWRLEKVDTSVYRIVSQWQDSSDYLTRQPSNDGSAGFFAGLQTRNVNWTSQQWFFIADGQGAFRLTSLWAPESGFLTRAVGGQEQNGQFLPGTEVRLLPAEDWTSQLWYFDRIGR